MKRHLFFYAASALAFTLPAQADIKDYCAAYARDFADMQAQKREDWQRRYDNAETACNTRYTPKATQVRVATPKPKRVPTKTVEPKPEKVTKPKPVEKKAAEKAPAEKVTAQRTSRPKPGTPEWVAYCTEKYASFNAKTGTYRSKSGAERPCLVTRDTKQRL
jgi:outer membrane biosynthesis protein TonB